MDNKNGHIVDLGALEDLFRKHYQFLCQIAYYVVADEEAARDIVQDFFYYCWNKRNEIAITGDFRNYAWRAVRNASLNYLKQARRTDVNGSKTLEMTAADSYPGNESWLREEERNKALWTAIDKLPEQRRRVFLLANSEGCSYAEIATQLNISVNTVKTQMRLAYQFLRQECSWLVSLLLLGTIFLK